MELKNKLSAIDQIYQVYDNFICGVELACKKHCAHCCTTGVTLTTLEGYKIIGWLEKEDTGWIAKIRQAVKQSRFKLKMTTNQFADMCAEGIEPPPEDTAAWDRCPFLTDSECPLYAVRPFGCRCLVSRRNCGKTGYADMDDFVLSVNTVFLQTIEHLDAGGCSGNLIEVLGALGLPENWQCYQNDALRFSEAGLIPNQPLRVLMIPPEHRSRMEPILRSLREIRI